MSKSKDSSVNTAVLEYLKKQNRPYSAIDVFNNLHKEHGKTAVVRSLEQLAEEKKVIEKTYGKQKIYFFDQSSLPDLDNETLRKMDEAISKATACLEELVQSLKTKDASLQVLSSSFTTQEAKNKLQQTNLEVNTLEKKLASLQSNSNQIPPEEKKAILSNYDKYANFWKKRKRLASDMIDAIMEGYPKSKKVFIEEVGIETDEDLNVSIVK